MGYKCPKCGYERRKEDLAPEYECPKCGVIYEKVITEKAKDKNEIHKIAQNKEPTAKTQKIFSNSINNNHSIKTRRNTYFVLVICFCIVMTGILFFLYSNNSISIQVSETKSEELQKEYWNISRQSFNLLLEKELRKVHKNMEPTPHIYITQTEIVKKVPHIYYCALRVIAEFEVKGVFANVSGKMETQSITVKEKIDIRVSKNNFDEWEMYITKIYPIIE